MASPTPPASSQAGRHYFRFHAPHAHLSPVFGDSWFFARGNLERHELAKRQSAQILTLLEQNTQLTEATQKLTQRIEELTDKIHRRVTGPA